MRNKSLIVGSLSALALTLAAGVASAHVGYGTELYNQGTGAVAASGTTGFNPTVSSNAGWISGQNNNGVNRTAALDTLADSHNNRFRFFTLTQNSAVSITVNGTANSNGASLLNPGISLFSGLVPAASHDGVGDTNGLTPAQITTLQSAAIVGTAANTPGDGGYLQNLPAGFATWSPFFDANDEIAAEGGPGTRNLWGTYISDGNVTMGNNNGQVSTMNFLGSAADGHGGDTQDNSVTWTGNLGPGTYSLVIGGSSLSALQSLFNLVQQGTGNPAQGFTACDPGNPVSCSGTAFPAAYATERLARNMQISMNVNGVDLQPVPVPAAAYLFGSGLIGLAGLARRKMAGKV